MIVFVATILIVLIVVLVVRARKARRSGIEIALLVIAGVLCIVGLTSAILVWGFPASTSLPLDQPSSMAPAG